MTLRAARSRLIAWSTLGCLATLPWVGLCVVRSTTGQDLGTGLQPAYLFLAIAVVASWPDTEPGRVLRRVPHGWIWPAALAAILLSALGVWRVPGLATPVEAWTRYGRQVLQWLLMAAFALHLSVWLRGEDRWRRVLIALMAGLVFQLVYGFWQVLDFYRPGVVFAALERIFTSNPGVLSGSEELFLGRDFVGIPRVRGTVCEPLYLGNYVLALLPWTILLAAGCRRLLWLTVGGVLLLVATWSRGAWLAALPGLLVALVALRRAGRLRAPARPWRLLAGAAVVLAAAHVLSDGRMSALMTQRLQQSLNMEDWSNLTRLYSMETAWRAFLQYPVFGIGWGQFGHHFARLVDPMGLQSQFAWPVVNNYPLAILCETGLIGIAAFGLAVGALTRHVRKRLDALAPAADGPVSQDWLRLVAAAAGATAVWCQLLTFSQYNLPHIWVSLGLLLAALADTPSSSGAPEGRS